MYHANLFPLIKHEPLPVYRYATSISPQPANRPQQYQILGIVARKIMHQERKPVVSIEQEIASLSSPILTLNGHIVQVPEVGKFSVDMSNAGSTVIGFDQFDEYKRLINRLADIALTVFSNEYYKFHPDAPYILRDEPYFDLDLIERIGIIDSKKYYRGLHNFNNQLVFVLNRETQLRSNKNLLHEMKSLKKNFELLHKTTIDFYNPPKEFVDYVNYLLVGKAAEVQGYPGPSIKKIKQITWAYRAKDVTPGSTKPHIEYLRETYGITGLDAICFT
jgi:hypothetical protein